MKINYTKLLARLIVVLVLIYAAIFGAWLAGADPSKWTFIQGGFVSLIIVLMATWWEP